MHRLVEELSTIGGDSVDQLARVMPMVKKAQAFLETEKTASKRYLSEDYMFCQYADRIGLKIWFCPWMQLQHVGTYVFGGSLGDLASIGAPATADSNVLKAAREAGKAPVLPPPIDPSILKAQEKRKKKAARRAK
jgi:hypothetical protein